MQAAGFLCFTPCFTNIITGNMVAEMKNNIKVYRAIHDLTQENLAEKVGVTRQTINAIEKGKYDPSLELAFKLSRLFKVRIEDIFHYEDGEN
jgi:putative transcriptional regulator